jgi:hypothetical protein
LEVNGIRDGDQILIEKLGEREYRFSPLSTEKPDKGPREQLVWTQEELILALDFYFEVGADTGQPIPGQSTARIRQLSDLIRRLSAYPAERQAETYRNANGVYKKLMNLRAVQVGGGHGLSSFGQRDAAVWREFMDNRARLHAEAEAIRTQLRQGVIGPASAEVRIEDTEIEQQHTESYVVNPSGEPRSAERAEQKLVIRYRDHMKAKGIEVRRKRYVPTGEVRPIYCDAWVEELRALIEAKILTAGTPCATRSANSTTIAASTSRQSTSPCWCLTSPGPSDLICSGAPISRQFGRIVLHSRTRPKAGSSKHDHVPYAPKAACRINSPASHTARSDVLAGAE